MLFMCNSNQMIHFFAVICFLYVACCVADVFIKSDTILLLLNKAYVVSQVKSFIGPDSKSEPCVHPFSFNMQRGHTGLTGSDRLLNMLMKN